MSNSRIARMKFRAWHRGTREADYVIGGFFDHYHTGWDEAALAWFEALLDEDDADILAWALGTLKVPDRYAGELMTTMQRFDFVEIRN